MTKSPPKVPGLPFIGSALKVIGRDPRPFLIHQYKTLGPIFRLKAMHLNYVVMAGPTANEFVNKEGRECFRSKTFWQGMMRELEADNFLIGLDGEEHTLLRKLFRKNFSRTAIDPHRETIHALCLEMLKDINPGEKFEVVERMLQLTSQMIGCVMTDKVPTREELHSFLHYINTITNHFSLHRLPAWMLKFRLGRFRKSKLMTLAFSEGVVEEHLTGTSDLNNFVDAVLSAAEKCPHLFSKGDVRFSAILPLFAGIDTLGQTLNYALFELHKNPHILQQVKKEITPVFHAGVPDTGQLKMMPTLNHVIMETLRLHPSAFGMVRTVCKDFEFEGYSVKKGEDVVILTTASHFLEQYFKDPYQFDINRYAAPRNEHRQRHVYAPFGSGPHICLGAGMAEGLMGLTLGSILHSHEFEILDPNLTFKERINPTPSLGRQFKLRLINRG